MKGEQIQAIMYMAVGAVAAIVLAVHWLIARRHGGTSESPTRRGQPYTHQPKAKRTNPYTRNDDDPVVSFQKGCRYYNSTKNRVFECIGTKGKKVRLVFFATLDRIDQERAIMLDDLKYGQTNGFHKVRIEDGIETCERGALRANRQATQQEIAAEFEFLREVRRREKAL